MPEPATGDEAPTPQDPEGVREGRLRPPYYLSMDHPTVFELEGAVAPYDVRGRFAPAVAMHEAGGWEPKLRAYAVPSPAVGVRRL
jgi:hypothetical protein